MEAYKECMKSELDLFTTSALQRSILKTEEVVYRPITSLDNNSSIEFLSLGHGNTYRDVSTCHFRLLIKLNIEPNLGADS